MVVNQALAIVLLLGIYDDDPEVITLSRSDFGELLFYITVFILLLT